MVVLNFKLKCTRVVFGVTIATDLRAKVYETLRKTPIEFIKVILGVKMVILDREVSSVTIKENVWLRIAIQLTTFVVQPICEFCILT